MNPEDFFKDEAGPYLKLEKDKLTKLRVLSDMVIGWEGWFANKPVRFPAEYKWPSAELNTLDVDDRNYPKRKNFMAFLVYNYELGAVQIWEVTQKTIQKMLLQLRTDQDWGGLTKHDIKVKREGDGLDTRYTVTPSPADPKMEEALKKAQEATKLDPEHLITDDKNKANVAAFRQAAGTASPENEKEDEYNPEGLNPEDIPF